MHHDEWSKLGEDNLGGPDGPNIRFMVMRDDLIVVGGGAVTLMKCILNDYWADANLNQSSVWDKEKIDMVMSKLYYCWVAMMQVQAFGDDEC